MRYLCLLFSLGIMNLFSQPQSVKPSAENDPEADKYLKALKTKFESLTSYKLSYKIAMTDANNKVTDMIGNYTGSGGKYIIESNSAKTIADGKTQWTIDKENKEIQIATMKPSKGNRLENPIDIVKRYNKFFKYRVKEPISDDKIVLELIPLDKNSSYFKIDLTIHTKKNQLISSKLYDRGGNRILFSFTKVEENLKLSPNLFTVDTKSYKDYEVLDMR